MGASIARLRIALLSQANLPGQWRQENAVEQPSSALNIACTAAQGEDVKTTDKKPVRDDPSNDRKAMVAIENMIA